MISMKKFSFLISVTMLAGSAFAADTIVPRINVEFWNGSYQWENNCYNYASNRQTNSFAQPGEAALGSSAWEYNCEIKLMETAADFGLNRTEFFEFQGKDDDTLVALVVAPDYDFHYYRRDDDNMWSHKMGGTRATNLDDSGQVISNPETADRGRYTEFCGYFRIKNYRTTTLEQNIGYVQIGNMVSPPSIDANEESYVEVLMYSGRPNPRIALRELLGGSNDGSQIAELLAQSIETAPKVVNPKLGYNGILIRDLEGILSAEETQVWISQEDSKNSSLHNLLRHELKNAGVL